MKAKCVIACVLNLSLALVTQCSRAEDSACATYRDLNKKYGLHYLLSDPDAQGVSHIRTHSANGEEAPREIDLSCPNAGSLEKADPCVLLARSPSGKEIRFEDDRITLFDDHGSVLMIAGHVQVVDKNAHLEWAIYKITNAGVVQICNQVRELLNVEYTK